MANWYASYGALRLLDAPLCPAAAPGHSRGGAIGVGLQIEAPGVCTRPFTAPPLAQYQPGARAAAQVAVIEGDISPPGHEISCPYNWPMRLATRRPDMAAPSPRLKTRSSLMAGSSNATANAARACSAPSIAWRRCSSNSAGTSVRGSVVAFSSGAHPAFSPSTRRDCQEGRQSPRLCTVLAPPEPGHIRRPLAAPPAEQNDDATAVRASSLLPCSSV